MTHWNFYSTPAHPETDKWLVLAEKFEDTTQVGLEVREYDLTQDEANAAAISLNRMAVKCGDHIALRAMEALDESVAA